MGVAALLCTVAILFQARSELRFWRGAEAYKVKNPKQLYVINLGKVRKMVSFCQRLKKLAILPVRRRRKLRFLQNFWRLRLKFKGFLCERRRRERKFWEYFAGERYFYASGRKGC